MVTSRRTIKQLQTLSCANCRMVFRVENLTPLTTSTRKLFCSACGSTDISIVELQSEDVWYAMAASFGLPQKSKSVDLIKQLFDVWDPTESNFKEFVSTVIEELNRNDNFAGE